MKIRVWDQTIWVIWCVSHFLVRSSRYATVGPIVWTHCDQAISLCHLTSISNPSIPDISFLFTFNAFTRANTQDCISFRSILSELSEKMYPDKLNSCHYSAVQRSHSPSIHWRKHILTEEFMHPIRSDLSPFHSRLKTKPALSATLTALAIVPNISTFIDYVQYFVTRPLVKKPQFFLWFFPFCLYFHRHLTAFAIN